MIWSHEYVQQFDTLYLAKGEAAASLSSEPHSTLWDPWLLIIIYETPSGNNVLDPSILKRIQDFENDLVASEDFQQYCVGSSDINCDP